MMSQTGSRGALISALCLCLIAFLASRSKFKLLMLFAPVLIICMLLIPSATLRRLATIFNTTKITTADELSAVESRLEREQYIKLSLIYTMTRPVFGVGAGQFPNAVTGDAQKRGEHRPWLVTHNSYTQISSECGLPAYFCYIGIMVISIRRAYGVYRFAAGKKEYRELEGLAFCLFSALVVYSVATFFASMAFSSPVLPFLTGQVMALYTAAEPIMSSRRADTLTSERPTLTRQEAARAI
jgi:O-antigen ligase